MKFVNHYLISNIYFNLLFCAGITLDTSSDESESNWQRKRDAERAGRAETKRLMELKKQSSLADDEESKSGGSNRCVSYSMLYVLYFL